jgi:predicted transcriptional regulator
MSNEQKMQLLLAFFKALSDENRLRIVGILLERKATVEEIAEVLGLGPPTVSHHLKQLAKAGLVSASAEGHYHVYSLKIDTLHEMAGSLLDRKSLSDVTRPVEPDAFDAKVLKDFMVDGRIKTIPSQRKKREVLLRHLATKFEPGRSYTEKEVSEVLAAYHEDVATLRRELVGYDLLTREDSVYRKVDAL